MSEKIEGHYSQFQVNTNAVAKESVLEQGIYRGERVSQQFDIQSLIADAAEELTFVASEKVEKDISKRKISSYKDRTVELIKRIERYLKQVPDLGSPEKLKEFLEHIKKVPFHSPSQLREETKKFFKDITHQYIALFYSLEVLEEEDPSNELIPILKEVTENLLAESGPEIRAGLNISTAAVDFSEKGLGEIQSLRDFYRENILNYESLSKLYDALLKNFDEDDFEKAVFFLIEAVGNDLRSQGPSISPAQLKQIMDDLYRLEVVGNFHRDCASLIEQIQNLFELKIFLTPSELAGKILSLREEKWLVSSKVENLIKDTGISNLEAKIFFLTELKKIVRTIPLKVFEDLDQREKFLAVIQETLDNMIELEE